MPVRSPNSLIDYLPAIYQEDPFVGKFLLAFQKVLLGVDDPVSITSLKDDVKFQPLEERIASIAILFDPIGNESQPLEKRQRTGEEFLNWLASWVALSLRDDWEEEAQRRFIGRIVSLYKQRGTKAGMREMLKTYTGMGVEVYEFIEPLQIGVTSTVGIDTAIGGGPAHYFRVKMFVDAFDPNFKERKEQIARAIIDQEKPAHTYYDLQVDTPTMQIAVHSTIGVDTLLGIPRDKA